MELRLMDNNLKSMCETVAEQLVVLQNVVLKTCNKCGRELPLTEFNKGRKNPDGLDYRCKECDAKQHKANQKKNRARGVIVIPGTKTCPGCKIEKPSLLFNKNSILGWTSTLTKTFRGLNSLILLFRCCGGLTLTTVNYTFYYFCFRALELPTQRYTP